MSETRWKGWAPVDRRSFLQGALAFGAGAALGPFGAVGQRVAGAAPGGLGALDADAGYGPLYPTRDQTTGLELLRLPRGFEYVSFGWTNDPMSDGTPTPGSHDGMAAFSFGRGRYRLVRNHEINGPGPAFGPAYRRLLAYLEEEYIPRTRETIAASDLPDGADRAQRLGRGAHRGVPLSPEDGRVRRRRLVRRRRAQRFPQLSRRASRGARAQDRDHFRGRAGRRAAAAVPEPGRPRRSPLPSHPSGARRGSRPR